LPVLFIKLIASLQEIVLHLSIIVIIIILKAEKHKHNDVKMKQVKIKYKCDYYKVVCGVRGGIYLHIKKSSRNINYDNI